MDLRTIELKIARGENLPILPQVVSAAFRMADDPTATAADLQKLIQQDAALTAKILKVVNSPMFGVGNVTSINRAVSVIGMSRVRSLITSFALQNLVAERESASRFNKLEYFRHSLAVATTARLISKKNAAIQGEEMYVAGLLHDIGLLLMDKFCPDILDSAIRYAQLEGVPMCRAEEALTDFTHAQLGGFLARRWGFGEFVATAIENHDLPVDAEGHNACTKILAVSNVIAHATGFTNQVPSVFYELSDEMLEAVGLSPEEVETMKDQICSELQEIEQGFALSKAPGSKTAVADPNCSPRLAARLCA
jgi:HD-like signal output (HDOD) protein